MVHAYQRGMISVTVIIVMLVAIFGGSAWYLSTQKGGGAAMELKDGVLPEGDGPMVEKDGAQDVMMEKAPTENPTMKTSYGGKVLAGSQAQLIEFNQADYEKAQASGRLIVLYFYANWCPLCKAEQPELFAFFNEAPDDRVVGFRVNYNDNDTDASEVVLARAYGVAYQHTKVFVKRGEQVLKSPENWDKARYNQEVQKALK